MKSQISNLRFQISNLKSQIRNSSGQPRGLAIMVALVTLVILSLMMSAIAWQLLANRRMLDHREYQLQADLLARAGIEHAAARLLSGPDGYAGETLQLIPLSSVTVELNSEPDSPGVYRVTSNARYPTDAADYVTRSVTRRFKRQVDGNKVQLVPISP
jgi:Tfp pilus assembly protein PilX